MNIFAEGALDRNMVCANFAHTTQHGAIEGKTQTRELTYYNLDVIISVGYCVKSYNANRLRLCRKKKTASRRKRAADRNCGVNPHGCWPWRTLHHTLMCANEQAPYRSSVCSARDDMVYHLSTSFLPAASKKQPKTIYVTQSLCLRTITYHYALLIASPQSGAFSIVFWLGHGCKDVAIYCVWEWGSRYPGARSRAANPSLTHRVPDRQPTAMAEGFLKASKTRVFD